MPHIAMGDTYNHQVGLRLSVPDLLVTYANHNTSSTNELDVIHRTRSKTISRSSQLNDERKELEFWNMSQAGENKNISNYDGWWDASDKSEQKPFGQSVKNLGQGLLNEGVKFNESKWSFITANNQSNTTPIHDHNLLTYSPTKFLNDSSRPKLSRSYSVPKLLLQSVRREKSLEHGFTHEFSNRKAKSNIYIDQIFVHDQLRDIHDNDNDNDWIDLDDHELGQTETGEYAKIESNDNVSLNRAQINEKVLTPPKSIKLWRIQKRYVKVPYKRNGKSRDKLPRKRLFTRASTFSIHTQPSCLHCYLNFMYFICVSTTPYCKYLPTIKKVSQVFQKCGFWFISISSILYSIDLLKYHGIEFLWDGHLHDYVQLGFLMMYTITRLYFVALQGFMRLKIDAAIRDMDKANCMSFNNNFWSPTMIAAILGSSSLLLAILGSVFGNIPFYKWSIDYTVKQGAYRVSHAILVWSTTNYVNVTSEIYKYYDNKEGWLTMFIALPRFLWVFCGCLLDFALVDVFIASTLSLITIVDGFLRKIALFKKSTRQLAYCRFKREWEQFKIINKASETFGSTFGTLLTLVHVYNLLQFALFLRLILIKEAGTFAFIFTAINVTKSMIIYVIAIQISDKNKACRHWVRQCVCQSLNKKIHRKFCMRTILMLDEMKENPLGLGRDEFFVNKGFLLAFLSLVASLFVMLVSNTKEALGRTD